MSELAIDVQHVVKRYAEHLAVKDLTLAVPQGTVYGLLGPNGAGKTTTIRMILNIIAPDEGTIRVLGAASSDQRIDYWLDRLSLRTPEKDWGAAKVDELSRGMQQKVQFIGTLLHDPDLVILDEPFSGLDPINAQALKDTVVELRKRGKTVIFSTHLMDNAERLCDAVCIIAGGEKVLDGTVAGVKTAHGARHIALGLNGDSPSSVASVLSDKTLVTRVDDQNQFFELELAPGASPQRLLERLVTAGAPITRFELVQPSLHQIFLQTVGAQGVEAGMSGQG